MLKRVMYTGGFGRQLDLPEKVATDKKGDDGKPVMRKVERTGEGALHLRPGRVHVLTDDELKLALEYKDMKKHLRVIGDAPAPQPKPEAKPPAPAPVKPERKPIAGRRGPSTATAEPKQEDKPRAKAKPSGGSGKANEGDGASDSK